MRLVYLYMLVEGKDSQLEISARLFAKLLRQKPLDIEEPVIVEHTEIEDLLALMLVGSASSGGLPLEAQDLLKYPSTGDLDVNITENVRLEKGEKLQCGLGPKYRPADLSPKSVRRWTLAAQALNRLDPRSEFAIQGDCGTGVPLKPCKGLTPECENIPTEWSSIKQGWNPTLLGWSDLCGSILLESPWNLHGFILPLIYGGVHLAGWNYHFASRSERIMWRISGITVMAFIPSLATLSFLALVPFLWTVGFVEAVETVLVPLGLIFCMFARISLVVESFISLRHAPLGVYAAVPWVQSLPHI